MGQPLSRGIQREIGTSALRLAERGRREGRIARGEGAWRKRFLYERIWRASSFVLERTACTCPILVLYSLSPSISISSHREIFSRANDLVLYFFFLFFSPHTPVLHSFLSPFAKNTSIASGTTFNRGPNCVAGRG